MSIDNPPGSESESPDPQTLHSRAAESVRETRQLLVAMSTASIGIFFLSLTGEESPPLPPVQKAVVVTALVLMAFATFAGVWSAHSDAQWSYCWAKYIVARRNATARESEWERMRARWYAHKYWSQRASMLFFVLGVLASSVYIALQAFR